VTITSVQKDRCALRITFRNGATIRRSDPSPSSDRSIAVTMAMIRKMLKRLVAATRLALKTDERPVVRLPDHTRAVRKVATTAGTTMFLRMIIVARMTTTPARKTQCAAVSCMVAPIRESPM
jgi:hypothetical protein